MPEKMRGRHCWIDDCPKTVKDGPLWRMNPKGQPGLFVCSEHAIEIREAFATDDPLPPAAQQWSREQRVTVRRG